MSASKWPIEKTPVTAGETGQRRHRRARRRHDEAVLQAEIGRLARALVPIGVPHLDARERSSDGRRWDQAGWGRALEDGAGQSAHAIGTRAPGRIGRGSRAGA